MIKEGVSLTCGPQERVVGREEKYKGKWCRKTGNEGKNLND
jgi:hypothetical protein